MGAPCGVRIRAIYGGVPRGEHIRSCREGVDILIATPGRLLDMAEYNQVKLDKVSYVTLDEADRMLDMGFEPDIRKSLGYLTPGYQMLLYTATWPKKIRSLAAEFLSDPVTVHVGDVGNNLVASKNVTQVCDPLPPPTALLGADASSRCSLSCRDFVLPSPCARTCLVLTPKSVLCLVASRLSALCRSPRRTLPFTR